MQSESLGPSAFFSKIGNADATRRFIHDIAPAMSVDEGDHLTLATVTSGKNRKETTVGRLNKADESEIVAFLQREVARRGEGRYKIRYTGTHGRRNGSRTFTYPIDHGNRRVPANVPSPPARTPSPPVKQPPPRRTAPSPHAVEPAQSPSAFALEAKVQELSTALTDLDSKNSGLYQQLERERAALAELKEEARATEQHLAETENALAETESAAQQVETECAELEEARDRLFGRVSQVEATARQAEGDRAAMEAERAGLMARLRQAEASVIEQAARIKKLKAKLRRTTGEREDLMRQLAHEQSRPRPADQNPKLMSLQRQLERATGERDRLRQSQNQLKQVTAREIATCRKEIEMIEDDRLKLRERALQLERENEKLQRQVRRLEAENAAGADYIRRMRGDEDDDEDEDEDDGGYVVYDFSDDDEDY